MFSRSVQCALRSRFLDMWVVESFADQDYTVLFCAVFHAVSVDAGSCSGIHRLAPTG